MMPLPGGVISYAMQVPVAVQCLQTAIGLYLLYLYTFTFMDDRPPIFHLAQFSDAFIHCQSQNVLEYLIRRQKITAPLKPLSTG